jgi:hypothetical protein
MSVDRYCNSNATPHQHARVDQITDDSDAENHNDNSAGNSCAFPQLDWLTLEGTVEDLRCHDYDENDACSPTEHSDAEDEETEAGKISENLCGNEHEDCQSRHADGSSMHGDDAACSPAGERSQDDVDHGKTSTDCAKRNEHERKHLSGETAPAGEDSDSRCRKRFGHPGDHVDGNHGKSKELCFSVALLSDADERSMNEESIDDQVCIVRVYMFMHTKLRAHMHKHTSMAYVYAYMHTYVHTYIHTYIHT